MRLFEAILDANSGRWPTFDIKYGRLRLESGRKEPFQVEMLENKELACKQFVAPNYLLVARKNDDVAKSYLLVVLWNMLEARNYKLEAPNYLLVARKNDEVDKSYLLVARNYLLEARNYEVVLLKNEIAVHIYDFAAGDCVHAVRRNGDVRPDFSPNVACSDSAARKYRSVPFNN